ncbi:glucosamine-6-phosphate deaminase [Oceaniglobus trochenteri]|uniref:glucosamine-6-phosphate deaminase n=1 Tax=Oceaniglobus trochenteri TaxID=2763260 RepID=UPI001CFFFE6E|nr:glucosamine-6-phosphate deaminase [Oceaniglobus trochenteri]
MEIRVLPDAAQLAVAGAQAFADALSAEPAMAAAIATGRSPIALYEQLAQMQQDGRADTGQMRAFQLDTYLGVPDDDRRSLWGWMERAFVTPLGISPDRVEKIDAMAPDIAAECRRYDAAIAAAGGLGLAILGLGPNGHVGFNEPPSPADAPTRTVALTPESLNSNAGYWGGLDQVPAHGVTMGMAPLLAARRVILVVTGAHKHKILRRAVEGPATPDVPASLFQSHPGTVVLADKAAWVGE